jgi:hypothetical protein
MITGLAGEAEHRLRHRQAQQLGVTQLRWPSRQPGDTGRIVIDHYVQCCHEGVQVCFHKTDLGHPRCVSTALHSERDQLGITV